MPLAKNELEILQIRKLIQCVREQDKTQIVKLINGGVPNLVNYQGTHCLLVTIATIIHVCVCLSL